MINEIKNFAKWATYNPSDIPLSKIALPIILLCVMSAVIIFLTIVLLCDIKISLKTAIFSVIASPYLVFEMFWGIYIWVYDKPFFIEIIPIYPLIAVFVLHTVVKSFKRKFLSKR